MDLIIKNKIIEAPITDIITTLRYETGNKYFNIIGKEGKEHLQVQCPFHKSGAETHPSASFYNNKDGEVEYGFFKCFTCGKKVPLYCVVNYCFNKSERDDFGKDWLVENFGNILPADRQLQPLIQPKKAIKSTYLDESILNNYNYIHPYMYKRKLTDEVISKYKIGYDPNTKSITFPCWDKYGNLVAVNKRSVVGKTFELASNTNKEIYLLNYALNENANCLYIMESQLNALSFMSHFPNTHAVALLGTGTKYQYDILNKSGIRSYVLLFDGDLAGEHGANRFIKNINNDCIITNIKMPAGKDVNDLSKEELIKLLNQNNININ